MITLIIESDADSKTLPVTEGIVVVDPHTMPLRDYSAKPTQVCGSDLPDVSLTSIPTARQIASIVFLEDSMDLSAKAWAKIAAGPNRVRRNNESLSSTVGISNAKARQLFGDDAEQWFVESLNLDKAGRTDEALDIVYSNLNEWLRGGRTTKCDAFLRRLDVEALPTRILLAIAILTRPASHEIPYRKEFFGRAWKALESRGKDAEKLLGRLRDAPYEVPAKRPSGFRRIFKWY